MSLINDALKKAARQRAEETNPSPTMPGGGGTVNSAGQGGPMSMQTMVLLGAAALVLIVVSAVVTGMLLAGKFDSKRPAPLVAEVHAAPPVSTAPNPAMTISVPKPTPAPVAAATPVPTTPPATVAVAEPTPAPAVAAAPKVEVPAPVSAVVPAPATAATTAAAAAAAAAAQTKNDNIQNLIDKYKVSGVRASGTDSKALIDGHVFKVGDYLDRGLGLKLTEVDQDHLTFTIKDGTSFTKSL